VARLRFVVMLLVNQDAYCLIMSAGAAIRATSQPGSSSGGNHVGTGNPFSDKSPSSCIRAPADWIDNGSS
jgi:hypothetical protein